MNLLFSFLPFAVVSTFFQFPSYALPPSVVSDKLDTLIIYTPVEKLNGQSRPRLLTFDLDGKKVSFYFAAFSTAAATTIASDILGKNNPELSESLQFTPYSLSKFDSLVQPLLGGDNNAKVRYIPDPGEALVAQKLLQNQGLTPEQAKNVSASVPSVFCPSPSFSISPNKGFLKGKTFVPCSTNSQLISDFVLKAKSDPSLKGKDVSVLAIPLPSFASLLTKGSKEDTGSIRILPSPADVKIITELRLRESTQN